MPPIERDAPLDGSRTLRHQQSMSSDHGKSLMIPMWDSSDPERAPPPLPLNPQSPGVSSSRPGTSSAIQSAHAALTEKAREGIMTSNTLLAKRVSEVSPERPLHRPTAHRRMQSLQTGSVRDRSLLLDSASSSPKSPEKLTRPSTPVRRKDSMCQSPDKNIPGAVQPPALVPGPSLTPVMRPTVRRPPQSILGENTPPQSATMLALQSMPTPAPKEKEPAMPLSDITNGSAALTTTKAAAVPPNFDPASLSHQIFTLTNIATSLQKEMAALSRRSRDNATDLLSLKQATSSRDEDIRKSLRELIGNIHDTALPSSRRDPVSSGLLIDNRAHQSYATPSKAARPFSLPRVPSANSFAASTDRDSLGTRASLSATDPPATIALLEKIVRDMGTKEGQDLLATRLSEVVEKLSGMASGSKAQELLDLVKKSDQAVVLAGLASGEGGGNKEHCNQRTSSDGGGEQISRGIHSRPLGAGDPLAQPVEIPLPDRPGRRTVSPPQASALINEDVVKIIRSVKDCVAQGGGLTAEVKALVRELRGEVLGMGRELRLRLDQMIAKEDEETGSDGDKTGQMERIIEDGLAELKGHMEHLLREHRRQAAALTTSRDRHVDYQDIYNATRAALKDSNANQPLSQQPPINRDDIMRAVSDAWETYKPEINIEQFGLERDEVLACLKEGLQMYVPRDDRPVGATRDEVFEAVVEGLKHFVPPKADSAASLSRTVVLDAVRECLEEFEFPVAPSAIGPELTRDDMLQAVQEGLNRFEFPAATTSEALTMPQPTNAEIITRLNEIIEFMRLEFRAVSDEAKENVAANGRDTEQVLDATKDGFEKLRIDMESYVDKIGQLSSRDDSLERLTEVLDGFRHDVANMLQSRIESLQDTVNMSIVPAAPQNADEGALEAIRDGLDSIRAELQRPLAGTGEIMDSLHDGLAELRLSIEKLSNRPMGLTANDEILDALKQGLAGVRSEIDSIRDSQAEKAVAPLSDKAIVPAEPETGLKLLKQDDIRNLEMLIIQLRIKVEALESSQASVPLPDTVSKEDISKMEDAVRHLKAAVESLQQPQSEAATSAAAAELPAPDVSLREDVQAIETILRNTKARLDDLMDGEHAVRKEHLDTILELLRETRGSLAAITTQMNLMSRREDVSMLESLISHVAAGYDEMKERAGKELDNPERVVKSDVKAVEAVCRDVKTLVDSMAKTDLRTLPTKEELASFVEELTTRIRSVSDMHTKAMAEHQAESLGVGARISEIKSFLGQFQDMTKAKLESGVDGIETLGRLLERMGVTIESNAHVGSDLRDMFETMKAEFEESRAGVVGVKLEADDKLQQTTASLSSKIDARIDELVCKYDTLQRGLEDRAKAGEARDAQTEAAVVGTKVVADELKLLIDTLGSTVTESLEKMEEASKTVFTRVEDLIARTDDNQANGKAEHEQTRGYIKQAIAAVEALHGPAADFQPRVLDAVKDILLIVGQHYEYSKASVTGLENKIEEAKPPPPPMFPPLEQYDDTSVQQKLDKLVDHSHAAGKALAQLDVLDKVQQQVLKTAADISDFLASQTKRINDEHEDREKTLQETMVELERKSTQKEHVEASIIYLRDEEERLKEVVGGLKAEQELLTRQKTRLAADVSSLETALRLRRDELHDMEARAEGLERRIIEGVMDHSRVLLMSKASRGPDAMSRKRVKVRNPIESVAAPGQPQHQTNPPVNMALAMKRGPNPAGAARRIVSLGQIHNNVAAGGFSRSHSVKALPGVGRGAMRAMGGVRKSSWGGNLAKRYDELGKENVSLKESEEEHAMVLQGDLQPRDDKAQTADDHDDVESDAGTLRRSSRGTTVVNTSTETGYDEPTDNESSDSQSNVHSDWTEGAVSTSLSESTAVAGNEGMLLQL